ncbi:uncharacterized protein VTP21DRAFT_2804 [Calcarisporiella thermophila]|uniref:uncharacterized protein n=1 Tax=Calcarisporiella thermophila TaxID=911321 RepID=UPI003743B95B
MADTYHQSSWENYYQPQVDPVSQANVDQASYGHQTAQEPTPCRIYFVLGSMMRIQALINQQLQQIQTQTNRQQHDWTNVPTATTAQSLQQVRNDTTIPSTVPQHAPPLSQTIPPVYASWSSPYSYINPVTNSYYYVMAAK